MSARDASVGVVGSGPAGLITAYTLIQDGFTNVQILTRDEATGGVWAAKRIYPGLILNNVHGEYRLSPLKVQAPVDSTAKPGLMTGYDTHVYIKTFADKFLSGKIRYRTEILSVRRGKACAWDIRVKNLGSGTEETLSYDKIVLCTGGASEPSIPESLSPAIAKESFKGRVLHSLDFSALVQELEKNGQTPEILGDVVIIGGRKSGQDIAAYMANNGVKPMVVFNQADAVLATPKPLPLFIRKSRFLSLMSPHIHLRTFLERFLHNTWLGAKIVHFVWKRFTKRAYGALKIPKDSPLRNATEFFWSMRANNEGVPQPGRFYALVNEGKINLRSPVLATGYAEDGNSIMLSDGTSIHADTVILATGHTSWDSILDEETRAYVGMDLHPIQRSTKYKWKYASLRQNRPKSHSAVELTSWLYRGIVPAKNILKRDFALNGAMLAANVGYMAEVGAHWISSYFLEDKFLKLPPTPEAAIEETKRNAAWLRQRYPDIFLWKNESFSSNVGFFSWPQLADDLLENMGLRTMRSGGNWLTWPFKIVDLDEIADLKEEREVQRAKSM